MEPEGPKHPNAQFDGLGFRGCKEAIQAIVFGAYTH